MPRVSFCAPASPRPASGWVDRREHFTERGGPTAIPGARRQRAACALQRLALLTDLRFGRPAPLPFFAQLGARWTPAAAALPHLDLYRRHDAAAWRHPRGDLRAHPRARSEHGTIDLALVPGDPVAHPSDAAGSRRLRLTLAAIGHPALPGPRA